MPQIGIMNWNVRTLSFNKVFKANSAMAKNLAQVIHAGNVDVVLLLEVRLTQVQVAMTALAKALNRLAKGNAWKTFFVSWPTGGECYAMFIRDLDAVRPMFPGLASTGPLHTLRDLRQYVFEVWPSQAWGTSAYPAPPMGPFIPLVDLFAEHRGRAQNFAGQALADAGYSEGRGYRMPAMPMLWIRGQAQSYLVPIVMCHFAAGQDAAQRNHLALGQIAQLKYMNIARMFDPGGGGTAGYLAVSAGPGGGVVPVAVQELCFTGDFNVDFLQNLAGGPPPAGSNRMAYDAITPTVQQGGSTAPPALPAAPGPQPAVPYNPPYPPPPDVDEIRPQQLRTAVTGQGTILGIPGAGPPPPPPPAPYVTAAFDNFFYGGRCLTQFAGPLVPPANDSGLVLSVPDRIKLKQLKISAIALDYAGTGTFEADQAPGLWGAGPLDDKTCRIGANLISDHLPVILRFECP